MTTAPPTGSPSAWCGATDHQGDASFPHLLRLGVCFLVFSPPVVVIGTRCAPAGDAGRFKKIVLGTRPSGRFVADVRVERSRLTVRLNGRKLVDEDVGYWTYSTNYFKAGGMLRLRGLLDVTGAVDVPACVFPSGGKPSLCPPLAPGRGCAWGRPPTGSARRPRQRVAWPGTYCPSRAL